MTLCPALGEWVTASAEMVANTYTSTEAFVKPKDIEKAKKSQQQTKFALLPVLDEKAANKVLAGVTLKAAEGR
jgi:hypothetical protein